MTKFDGVSTQYNNLISQTDHYIDMVEGYQDQFESAGYMASEAYYKAIAKKQEENIALLQDKYSSLLGTFDEAVKNGSVQKFSDDWYSMLNDINDVESELQSATTQLIEFNQTLQQLSWDVFDRIQDSVSGIAEEANFLIDILDSKDLHTDSGAITDEGLAVQGLHAVNYNTYMEQAIAYAEEMARIEEEMAKDPYDMELVDRRNELIELQQDAISNAIKEKESIIDLVKNGYDKMLESLDKVIQKNKDALNAEKSLFDYEKSIESKTSNIASLRKQLQAYSTDNSESAKATIQKLQLSLTEAEDDLKQTEYEKYISDQEQMLDTLYSQTEQWINERLDGQDALIAEVIDATNQNADTISKTIKDTASSYGVELSEQMETIWDSANNVVSVYGDIFHSDMLNANNNIASAINGGTTNVITAIDGLGVSMKEMVASLNAIATANTNSIASAQNTIVNGQSSVNQSNNVPSVPTGNNPTPNVPTGNGSNNSSTNIPKKSIVYNVRLRSTGALLKTGTASECESWINSNSIYERDGNVADGTYWVKAKEPKYVLLDKQKNIVAANLTKAQATGRMNAQGNALGWTMQVMNAYATGTPSAKKGWAIVGEGKDGNEIILDKEGNALLTLAPQLLNLKGGEQIINGKDTAKLLTPNLVPLSAEQLWGNIVKTPKLPEMVSRDNTSSIQQDINVNFELPNVTDANSLITELQNSKRFEKVIQSITTDQMLGKGILNKFKF